MQQARFTVAGGLALVAGFLFPRQGGLLAGLRRFELPVQQATLHAQQVTLHAQQVTLLLYGEKGLYFCGRAGLVRVSDAWCCILKRSTLLLLHAPLERVAGTQQFSSVETAVSINA